mgnify:FL=1
MERKNYYSWALALLCTFSTNAVAQTVPRPALFGIDINAATQQRVPENKAKPSAAPFGTTTKSVAKAHVVPAPKSSEETINVLTGIKRYDGKDQCIGTSTFEYDKQGRILVEDNGYSRYDYTYTDNADGDWIEMLVVYTDENGKKSETLSKRDFDSQGRIIAGYTYRSNSTDGQLELDFEANYVYTESGECIETKLLYSIGRTNDNDVVWNGHVLTWYEPIQDYIEDNYYWDKYSKTSVEGDICTTNYYKLKSESEGYSQGFYKYKTWSRSSTNKDFIMVEHDQWSGLYPYSLIYTYNIDGSLSDRDGVKIVYEEGVPAKGYTRKTEYHSYFWMDELWTPGFRESYTNGFDEKKLNSEGYREKIFEGYNTFTGWHVNMKERYEAVPCNIDGISIQKRILTNYDEEGNETSVRTRNTFYNTSDNSEVYNIYLYDNGNYVKGERESDECFVYVFYDSKGKELKRLRSILESIINEYDHRYILEELKDGVWTKITNQKIEIGENEKLILQLDENGYTKYEETYHNGQIYSRTEYTYTDDGYTSLHYSTTGKGVLYLGSKLEFHLSSDNVLTDISVGYNIDGSIVYGRKIEHYPNGLEKIYDMNRNDGKFYFSRKSISDYVSTDENGYVTTIKRTVDDQDNENVDEVSKTITRRTEDYSYIESYEKKDGKWVGVNKEEQTFVTFPEFDLLPNNDSRAMVENWRIFFGCPNVDSKYYAWDTANDKWVLSMSSVSEFAVNGNMLEYKNVYHKQQSDTEVTGYVKRDDAHRMTEICRVDKTIYPNGNTEVNRTLLYKYTYNSDGKLAQQEIYQDDTYLGRTVYIYGDIVVTEVEQIIDGAAYKLRISGRDIVANSKSAIKLYDMSGRVVAQGSNGKVVAPANGMYVVSVDGKNIKISVNAK